MDYKKEELEMALKQITSLLHKLEAIDKEKQGKSQRTLLIRRIAALQIASVLIEEKLLKNH